MGLLLSTGQIKIENMQTNLFKVICNLYAVNWLKVGGQTVCGISLRQYTEGRGPRGMGQLERTERE